MLSNDPTLDKITQAFRQQWGVEPTLIAQAPGRINLLGAHVDYNEGWVFPAAIDRRIVFAAKPLSTAVLEIQSLDYGETIQCPLAPPPDSQSTQDEWWRVIAAVAWVLRQEGYEVPGLQITLSSTIPIGAGMSSSAALEVGLLLLWVVLEVIPKDPWTLAKIARRAENDYLSVGSGIMDQFASLWGREKHLLYLDCRELEHQAIPLPGDPVILVADSGIRRRLSDSGFNDRRAECFEATRRLRAHLGDEIQTLRDVTPQHLEDCSNLLTPRLYRRVRHVVEECRRVHQGREALLQWDLPTFGELIQASGVSSRDLYEVSLPELDCLTEAANGTAGCFGSRLSGGGFGGCVTALCTRESSADVQASMIEAYQRSFQRPLAPFEVSIGGGASGRKI